VIGTPGDGTLDVSEFETVPRAFQGIRCWWVLRPFTAEQRAKLEHVLFERPDITANAIAKVIADWGYGEISDQTIRRHRTRKCCRQKPS
jgi:hypothetical protein